MLDAYIIERIRKEREESNRRKDSRVPLHIDAPRPVKRPEPPDESSDDDRGSTVIDFVV